MPRHTDGLRFQELQGSLSPALEPAPRPAGIQSSDPELQTVRQPTSCCFKALHLWQFVTAAARDSHRWIADSEHVSVWPSLPLGRLTPDRRHFSRSPSSWVPHSDYSASICLKKKQVITNISIEKCVYLILRPCCWASLWVFRECSWTLEGCSVGGKRQKARFLQCWAHRRSQGCRTCANLIRWKHLPPPPTQGYWSAEYAQHREHA